MPAVRDETHKEVSWAMFKDCRLQLSIRRLISLWSFVFVQRDIPEVSQFSISPILKFTNNSEIAAVADMFAVENF